MRPGELRRAWHSPGVAAAAVLNRRFVCAGSTAEGAECAVMLFVWLQAQAVGWRVKTASTAATRCPSSKCCRWACLDDHCQLCGAFTCLDVTPCLLRSSNVSLSPCRRMQEMAQQIQKETAQSKQAAAASRECCEGWVGIIACSCNAHIAPVSQGWHYCV